MKKSGTTDSTEQCPTCGSHLLQVRVLGMCPRCVLFESMTPEPGAADGPNVEDLDALLENYDVVSVIGRGGMGIVYLANDLRHDREVAIKVLASGPGASEEVLERFRREAIALEALDHPGIIKVYDHGELPEEAGLYLVMEYVAGKNLAELIAGKRLDPARAMKLIPQLCAALDHAHAKGIVHRDIKPSNLLVADGKTDTIKIVDFGLARLFNDGHESLGLTTASERFGTPIYMAPEQRKPDTPADHRADIYSLGVVIYEMLTGEAPIGKFLPPSKCAGTRPALDRIIDRALSPDPSKRYGRAGEISERIDRSGKTDSWKYFAIIVGALLLALTVFVMYPTSKIEVDPPYVETTKESVGVRLLKPETAFVPAVSDIRERAALSISLAGSDLIVGAPRGKNPAEKAAGSVYAMPIDRSGVTVQVRPSGSRAADRFGASTAGSEDWFIAGAPGSESAILFRRAGDGWNEEFVFRPPTAKPRQGFGWKVAGDERRIVVSQIQSQEKTGIVYLFEERAGDWPLTNTLKPSVPSGSRSGGFGCDLALGKDLIVVGANAEIVGNIIKQGAAYVFRRDPATDTWSQEACLHQPRGHKRQLFGDAVALLDDRTIAVGASRTLNDRKKDTGAAYIFESQPGGKWELVQTIEPPLENMRTFGVMLRFAGDKLAIGADLCRSVGPGRGSVSVFAKDGKRWVIQHVYGAEHGSPQGHLGYTISSDPERIAIGGHCDSTTGSAFAGEAFVLPIGGR